MLWSTWLHKPVINQSSTRSEYSDSVRVLWLSSKDRVWKDYCCLVQPNQCRNRYWWHWMLLVQFSAHENEEVSGRFPYIFMLLSALKKKAITSGFTLYARFLSLLACSWKISSKSPLNSAWNGPSVRANRSLVEIRQNLNRGVKLHN